MNDESRVAVRLGTESAKKHEGPWRPVISLTPLAEEDGETLPTIMWHGPRWYDSKLEAIRHTVTDAAGDARIMEVPNLIEVVQELANEYYGPLVKGAQRQ